MKRYGLTPEDYCRMLAEQGGVCKICGSPPTGKYLYVDHNHVTGVVRGLLCHSCNSALGYAKDDPELLRAMADYLDRREYGSSKPLRRCHPGSASPG